MDEQVAKAAGGRHIAEAAEILTKLILADTFTEFLTLPAYERLA
jgi:malate synthase